jgi:hypothetical protein
VCVCVCVCVCACVCVCVIERERERERERHRVGRRETEMRKGMQVCRCSAIPKAFRCTCGRSPFINCTLAVYLRSLTPPPPASSNTSIALCLRIWETRKSNRLQCQNDSNQQFLFALQGVIGESYNHVSHLPATEYEAAKAEGRLAEPARPTYPLFSDNTYEIDGYFTSPIRQTIAQLLKRLHLKIPHSPMMHQRRLLL